MGVAICTFFITGCGKNEANTTVKNEESVNDSNDVQEEVDEYLIKSRESKDISKLDVLCSALLASIASLQIEKSGHFEFGNPTTDAEKKIQNDMEKMIGEYEEGFDSEALAGCGTWLTYFPDKNVMYVYASVDGEKVADFQKTKTGADAKKSEDLKCDNWDNAAFVSN